MAICIHRIWIKNASFVSSIWLVYWSHFHFGIVATAAAIVAHWRRRRHLHSAFDSFVRMCVRLLFMNGSLKCTGASIETFNSIKCDETITRRLYCIQIVCICLLFVNMFIGFDATLPQLGPTKIHSNCLMFGWSTRAHFQLEFES